MNETGSPDIWRFVSENETTITSHLRTIAEMVPPSMRQQVRSVAKRIERDCKGGDAKVQHGVLADREVLSVLSPLLEDSADSDNGNTLSDAELLAYLQTGVCRLAKDRVDRSGIIGLFAYPGLLLVGLIGVVMLFSRLVAPSMRNVLDEFGIELPSLTKIIFGFTDFLETAWPLVVLFAFLAALPMIVELCRSLGWAPGFVRWIDNLLSGRRLAVAALARHTALLLQSQIDQDVAIETSTAAAKNWLRSGVLPWRFGLLEETLKLEDRRAKIALLNQTADYCCAHHRNWVQWWASFLPTILVCLLGAFLFLVVVGIFAPLFSVIRGLSGMGLF